MRTLTRWIAELLFEHELDEDYNLGIRYGQQLGRDTALLQLRILHDQAPKRDQPGILRAIKQLGGEK